MVIVDCLESIFSVLSFKRVDKYSSNVLLRFINVEDVLFEIDLFVCSKPIESRLFSSSGIFTRFNGCGFWLRASFNDGYRRRLVFHWGFVLIRKWVKFG